MYIETPPINNGSAILFHNENVRIYVILNELRKIGQYRTMSNIVSYCKF